MPENNRFVEFFKRNSVNLIVFLNKKQAAEILLRCRAIRIYLLFLLGLIGLLPTCPVNGKTLEKGKRIRGP